MARAAEPTAFSVRLRETLWVTTCDATRATTPNFRAVESWLTPSILTVSGATMTQRKPHWEEMVACTKATLRNEPAAHRSVAACI